MYLNWLTDDGQYKWKENNRRASWYARSRSSMSCNNQEGKQPEYGIELVLGKDELVAPLEYEIKYLDKGIIRTIYSDNLKYMNSSGKMVSKEPKEYHHTYVIPELISNLGEKDVPIYQLYPNYL